MALEADCDNDEDFDHDNDATGIEADMEDAVDRIREESATSRVGNFEEDWSDGEKEGKARTEAGDVLLLNRSGDMSMYVFLGCQRILFVLGVMESILTWKVF